MEEDDAARGSVAEGGSEAVEVESSCSGVVVRVLRGRQRDVVEDLLVVGPGGVGEVDGLVLGTRVEFGEEATAGVDGAGAGDGLDGRDLGGVLGGVNRRKGEGRAYPLLCQCRAIGTKY